MKISSRLAVVLSLFPLTLAASPKESLDLAFATQQFSGTAISPDGRRIAWVEPQKNPDRTESRATLLYLLDPDAKTPRRVTAGDGQKRSAEQSLTWSPDGTQIAFLSDAVQAKQLQLYVAPAEGGTPRVLTKFVGRPAQPRWSPDGRTLAVLLIEGSTRDAGPTAPAARLTGDVEEKILEQRLALVDVATGALRFISAADTHVYEYDWAPDSRGIVFTAAQGAGDNNWWIARLYAVDVAGGAVRELFKPATQIAVPRWSPDGQTIAFIHGLMSDFGSTGGDIWLVPARGGEARNLTPGRKTSPAWLAWQRATGKILCLERVQGGNALTTFDAANGNAETLWRGDESIAGLAIASDGVAAALVRSSPSEAPEVWRGPIGAWQRVTSANLTLKPLWGTFEKVEWQSDGLSVQGWLLWPRIVEAGRRYPMVVSVHGGPAAQFSAAWPAGGGAALANEGYFVFFPNPRGSFGQGAAFAAANVKDFGHGDLRDIMAGVDAVLKKAPIDPQRLGLTGHSYGGFMTMWTVTQTNRFRAAVASAGIANWQSYYGQNLIDQWMIPYFGASVYDDPAVYAKSSPINFIKNVRTPTLIMVGDSDAECPPPQSQEFWHALKALGVKTKLVIYENEGHSFRVPAHREDALVRTIAWFDENLK